ncbi:E3 ubiquitin-protein ligase Mdm2-like isoform X2 [Sipha flava]|uniref:E3 ubiquitin-protein ligase Mdm2-like isoform X2 n=1 Tax=Sipha flava TaxID=143950 RepID=A0A8B8GPE9_9HEMI|nr:E3 ubiquitin-protein ligase Mdm2-like isoform X2 [Sipha flava]
MNNLGMANQTIKRKVEGNNSRNVTADLNDDEFDITWGGKRSRYIYNYTLQSPNSIINEDSDDTESILSIQSKTTKAVSSNDSSDSCSSECDCQDSSQSTIHSEYEVVNSSSPNCIIDSNSSDSSSLFDYEVQKMDIVCDIPILDSDIGYLPDDSDTKLSLQKNKWPTPACFKKCLQCLKENSNPYFQYCFTCFKYRMDFFGSKPKPKKVKCSNVSIHKSEECSLKDSQDSGISNSQQSNKIGISSLFLNKSSFKNVENRTVEMFEELCNICFNWPKNGVFTHGKTSHIYCCYGCAKQLWKKNNKCPLCNVKVKLVTKMIVV